MTSGFLESGLNIARFKTRALIADHRTSTSAPTLLFIHGWSDSADSFKPLMRMLADTDARLIALDLPHFGKAEDLPPGPQLPQLVDFAEAAIRQFSTGSRLIPVGQSLGGRALLMALARSSGIAVPAVVAIAPAPMDLPPWQKMLVRNSSLATSASTLADPLPHHRLVEDIVKSYRRTCFANTDDIPEEVFIDYASHCTPARVQRHIESLRNIGAEMEKPIDLQALTAPVELLWGTQDRMAPIVGAQRYLRNLPNARLNMFEGGGHHLHLERAAEVAALIRQKLGDLKN